MRTVKRNQQIRVQVKRLKEGRPKLRAMIEKEKAKKKVRTHSYSVALAGGVVTRAPPPRRGNASPVQAYQRATEKARAGSGEH